jgi:hypothetical protein
MTEPHQPSLETLIHERDKYKRWLAQTHEEYKAKIEVLHTDLAAARDALQALKAERDTAFSKARYCCASGERTMADTCCLETLEADVRRLREKLELYGDPEGQP